MEARKVSKSIAPPYEMSLRIRHPSIDPAEISRALSLEADHSFRAGEPRDPLSSGTVSSTYTESYWLGSLDPLSWQADLIAPEFIGTKEAKAQVANERARAIVASSLGAALNLFARRFLLTHSAFIQKIQSDGGQVALLVSLDADEVRSFTITPDIARAFDKLGMAVEFEFGG